MKKKKRGRSPEKIRKLLRHILGKYTKKPTIKKKYGSWETRNKKENKYIYIYIYTFEKIICFFNSTTKSAMSSTKIITKRF